VVQIRHEENNMNRKVLLNIFSLKTVFIRKLCTFPEYQVYQNNEGTQKNEDGGEAMKSNVKMNLFLVVEFRHLNEATLVI